MTVETTTEAARLLVDKQWLREELAKKDVEAGFVLDEGVTAEQVQAMMRADGVVPEANEASREIMRLRDRKP